MTPVRITLGIIISWTLLFLFHPLTAMLFIFPAFSVFFFYNAINGVRNGVTRIAYGLSGFAFDRRQKPFMFWFFISFSIFWGILTLGMGVLVVLKNFRIIEM
jgi:hypothetical protein